jgi:hypothetical protein
MDYQLSYMERFHIYNYKSYMNLQYFIYETAYDFIDEIFIYEVVMRNFHICIMFHTLYIRDFHQWNIHIWNFWCLKFCIWKLFQFKFCYEKYVNKYTNWEIENLIHLYKKRAYYSIQVLNIISYIYIHSPILFPKTGPNSYIVHVLFKACVKNSK